MANQFGDNGGIYYFGQGYQKFDSSQMSEFNLTQQHYGHRASDPLLGSLQLSDLARAGREAPVQRLTKPEHHQPWNSQIRHAFQQQQQNFDPQVWQGNLNLRGAKTEPVPHHENYIQHFGSQNGSEAEDSTYASMPTSSVPHDTFNLDKRELEKDFPSGGYFPALKSEQGSEYHLAINPPNPPQSVKSEGHHLTTQPRDNRRRQTVRPCEVCGRRPKNLSDAKKHSLTHTKPHRCTEPNCERKDGFATDNDLQRHRKSVHNLLPTVGSAAGYICAACPPPDGGGHRKFWPRRDNFKAHIKRKHPDWAENRLIEVSKQIMRPDDTRTVEDDNKSVRSAMHSSRHSQGDHTEMHGYQMSPNLDRNASDQSQYADNVFPNSAIDMHQDNFAGMGGHATDTNMAFSQYGIGSNDSHDANGMDMLPGVSNDYNESMLSTSPFKKPKLNTQDNYQYPTFQITVSEHSTSSNTQPTTTPSPNGEYRCPKCTKVKRRECDLKKHMKRHTRPYGCTFPACHKKFGSRNDWKRHESSQHFLHEMYKCERPRHDGTPCTRRPFRDIEALKKHLRGDDHGLVHLTDAELQDECRRYLLGREGHERFWCGFCQRLVSQEKALQNAWDARFKHIGDHFDKEGRDSGDWVCVEENKAKKYILPPQGVNGEDGGKRRNGKMSEKREAEEEPDLPDFLPGEGGFVVPDVTGGYGGAFGYLGGGKRKQMGVDVDAEGESDYDMH